MRASFRLSSLVFALTSLSACRPAPEAEPPTVEHASGLQVVDATDAYLALLRRGGTAPYDDETQAFLDTVFAQHPKLYSAEVIGFDEERAPREALTEILPEYLPHAYAHAEQIEGVAQAFLQSLDTHRVTFESTFGRFTRPTPVYLTASLGSFDGGARIVDGEPALLFGIDGIAMFHQPDTDLAPFFHHELFHMHHGQTLEALGAELGDDTVGKALWIEGVATYVSHELNPEATLPELLLSETMVHETDARMAELATELADNLHSSDGQLFADYFIGQGGDRIPDRCGYYIGMRVAEHIARNHSLQDLATLDGDTLYTELDTALRTLATPDKR